ncbi:larval cuticle protein LCP-22-like [Bombyx mandarina]|uniref:Larval cuticle protein LCP-22-like n=2 Tax=Bombyx TaxID=7090 RepID=A0A6J2JQH4_BOMMA|nr:cuticular protein RR-1 motif 39 precursor [Bombyx mori]XP_028031830.1 larval cuticle protein LCP-22-like [Bombyx mandarina]FAA00542.1 TPA: putative cuticle protein [Bombyx mori]
MKFFVVFAAVVAVSAAQFGGFIQSTRIPGFPRPTIPPPPPPRPTIQAILPNRVATNEQAAETISYQNEILPDGSYSHGFETNNGISAQAQGTPRDFGGNPPVVPVVSQGSFAWTSPEGQPIVITYIADENGYQPQGDAIPTPPPIPEAILRALDFIARNPPAPQKK